MSKTAPSTSPVPPAAAAPPLRVGAVLLALVLFSVPGAPAAAPGDDRADYSEMDLEQLLSRVITATKRDQAIEEAPATVAVITCTEIAARGYRSVADALRAIPGLAVIDDHTYQHIGVRGIFSDFETPNDIIKVMVNGQPVSFRPLGGGFLGTELIPIEAVKRIEVLRGPGSALYGAHAFLGVINVITFDGSEDFDGRPAEDGHSRHAVALEGSAGTAALGNRPGGRVSFLSGGAWGPFAYFVAGHYEYQDRSGLRIPGLEDMIVEERYLDHSGQYAAPAGYPSPGWDPAHRERLLRASPSADDIARTGSLYGRLAWSFGEAGQLALDGGLQYFDRHAEFQEYSALTHDSRLTYLNGYTRLRYALDPGAEGFGLAASLAVAAGAPTDDHIIDPLTPSAYKKRRLGFLAIDAVLEASYVFGPEGLLLGGLDLSIDSEDLSTMEVHPEGGGAVYDEPGFGDETFTTIGAYLQGQYSPLPGLTFTAGARFDYSDVIGCNPATWGCLGEKGGEGLVQLSSRAGVTYLPGVGGLYVKAMYGSSFRPPSPFQLFHYPQGIVGSQGNPELLPETAETFDLVLGAKPVAGLHAYAGFYYTYVRDMVLSYLSGDVVESRNADARVYGLEGGLSYAMNDRLSLFVNASWLIDGTVRPQRLPTEGDRLWEMSLFNDEIPVDKFPRVMVNGGVTVRAPESHLSVNLMLHWVGERRASLVNNLLFNTTSLEKTYTLKGYLMGSLTVSTLGLRWAGMESVLSLSFQYVPGDHVDPGDGGIDIPGSGPRVFLRYQHRF